MLMANADVAETKALVTLKDMATLLGLGARLHQVSVSDVRPNALARLIFHARNQAFEMRVGYL